MIVPADSSDMWHVIGVFPCQSRLMLARNFRCKHQKLDVLACINIRYFTSIKLGILGGTTNHLMGMYICTVVWSAKIGIWVSMWNLGSQKEVSIHQKRKIQLITNFQKILWMEEFLHHLGWLKPYEKWEEPSINLCRISSIHSMVLNSNTDATLKGYI